MAQKNYKSEIVKSKQIEAFYNKVVTTDAAILNFKDIERVYIYLEVYEAANSPDLKKSLGIFESMSKALLNIFLQYEIFPSRIELHRVSFFVCKRHYDTNSKNYETFTDDIIRILHQADLLSPSIVIYPLIGLGFQHIGLMRDLFKVIDDVSFSAGDFILFPQSNKIERTKEYLNYAIERFKMKSLRVREDMLNHALKSRPLQWFHRNPLMFVKMRYSSSTALENEYFLVSKFSKNVIIMYLLVHSVESAVEKQRQFTFSASTHNVNNFSTKDIKHYLLLTKEKKALDARAVMIHSNHNAVFQLNDIPIDIDIKLISDNSPIICELLDYLTVIKSTDNTNTKKFKNRLLTALRLFVRSVQSDYVNDNILYLCVAYEMVFCDSVQENILPRLLNVLKSLNESDLTAETKMLKELYGNRSGIAHEGTMRFGNFDLIRPRLFFVKSILKSYDYIQKSLINTADEHPFKKMVERHFMKKIGFSPNFA